MSNRSFSLDDYIDVGERIQLFTERYPEGSLQSNWSVTEVKDRTFIVCEAFAFRTPDDQKPGHGLAWEPFPGATPYTRESELMNSQTAAWGRAIVAVGIVANRKIASRQEVKARQEAERQGANEPTNGKPAEPEPPRPKPQEVDTALEVVREAAPKLPKGKLGMLLRAHGAQTVEPGSGVRAALQSMTPEGLVAFVQDIAATVAASEVAA